MANIRCKIFSCEKSVNRKQCCFDCTHRVGCKKACLNAPSKCGLVELSSFEKFLQDCKPLLTPQIEKGDDNDI